MPTWWQDDCACSVLDTSGDGCGLTTDTDEPTHLCRHCKAHAAELDRLRAALRDAGQYIASLGGDESAIVAAQIAADLVNGVALPPDAVELDRLRRIEALATDIPAVPPNGSPSDMLTAWLTVAVPRLAALSAALAPEGSAGTETDECLIHLDHQSTWDALMGVLGNPETAQAVIVALRAAEGSARDGG